jgi:uncharacterized protein (TIGR02598 family)
MKTRTNQSGFSLIETVIALGIMGLAVTALLGLLPHGMEMSKKAASASAQSRIVDFVRGELAHYKLTTLQAMTAPVRFQFDEEGMNVDTTDRVSFVSYVAEVQPPTGRVIRLPGGDAEPYLLNFAVKVAATPNRDFSFLAEAANRFVVVPLHIGPTIP